MKTRKYESIPHLIEAVKLSTENLKETEEWCGGSIKGIYLPLQEQVIAIWNNTLDRELRAEIGDYIYTDDTGEFFVSDEALFLEMYRIPIPKN